MGSKFLATAVVCTFVTVTASAAIICVPRPIDDQIARTIVSGTVPTSYTGASASEVTSYFRDTADDLNRVSPEWLKRINKKLVELNDAEVTQAKATAASTGRDAWTVKMDEFSPDTTIGKVRGKLLILRPILSGNLPERGSDSPTDYVGVYRYGYPNGPLWVFETRPYHEPHLRDMRLSGIKADGTATTTTTVVPINWGEYDRNRYQELEKFVAGSTLCAMPTTLNLKYWVEEMLVDKFGRTRAEMLELLERRLNELPLCKYCKGPRFHKVFPFCSDGEHGKGVFVVVHGDEKNGQLIGSMIYPVSREAPYFRGDLGESGMPSDSWRKAHGLPPNK